MKTLLVSIAASFVRSGADLQKAKFAREFGIRRETLYQYQRQVPSLYALAICFIIFANI